MIAELGAIIHHRGASRLATRAGLILQEQGSLFPTLLFSMPLFTLRAYMIML